MKPARKHFFGEAKKILRATWRRSVDRLQSGFSLAKDVVQQHPSAAVALIVGLPPAFVALLVAASMLGLLDSDDQPERPAKLVVEAKVRVSGENGWSDEVSLSRKQRVEIGAYVENLGDRAARRVVIGLDAPRGIETERASCRITTSEQQRERCTSYRRRGVLVLSQLAGGATAWAVIDGRSKPSAGGGQFVGQASVNSDQTDLRRDWFAVAIKETSAESYVRRLLASEAENRTGFWVVSPQLILASKDRLIRRWPTLGWLRAHSYSSVPQSAELSPATPYRDYRFDGLFIKINAYVLQEPIRFRFPGSPNLIWEVFPIGIDPPEESIIWCRTPRQRGSPQLHDDDWVWVRGIALARGKTTWALPTSEAEVGTVMMYCPGVRRKGRRAG